MLSAKWKPWYVIPALSVGAGIHTYSVHVWIPDQARNDVNTVDLSFTWIISVDVVLELRKCWVVFYFHEFVGHKSSVSFIYSIFSSIWCSKGNWSECCINCMCPNFFWWISKIYISYDAFHRVKIFCTIKFCC